MAPKSVPTFTNVFPEISVQDIKQLEKKKKKKKKKKRGLNYA
jgi:hypothetical protein